MMLPVETRLRPALTIVRTKEPNTDVELVLLSQKKDKAAFELLVKRYQRAVYSTLYQLAPDWNHLSDLSQEVFIRAWRSIGSLRNPRAFRSWLNQIATNLFYDELRKRLNQLHTVSMDAPYDSEDGDGGITRDIADASALPDECLQRKELSSAIRHAIGTLPEQFRVAIILRELQGLSYEEIAILTDCQMGTVKSRIARARTRVQELMGPYLSQVA